MPRPVLKFLLSRVKCFHSNESSQNAVQILQDSCSGVYAASEQSLCFPGAQTVIIGADYGFVSLSQAQGVKSVVLVMPHAFFVNVSEFNFL